MRSGTWNAIVIQQCRWSQSIQPYTWFVFTLIYYRKCLRDWNIKVYGYGIEKYIRRIGKKEKKRKTKFNLIRFLRNFLYVGGYFFFLLFIGLLFNGNHPNNVVYKAQKYSYQILKHSSPSGFYLFFIYFSAVPSLIDWIDCWINNTHIFL